jgi:hypothetical protein
MKKVNLFYLFIPILVSTTWASANPKLQTPVWPGNMMPYNYQWPAQQQMLSAKPIQMAPVFPPNYVYPMYQKQGMTPYNTMRYPQNYPAISGFPATQTAQMYPQQQAQAVYPYVAPMKNPAMQQVPQGQYRYPVQSAAPYRKPIQAQNNFKKKQKPWGDTRYIWPDFYTDATGDMWDNMVNAPYDMGRMPGGWQFPSLSSPDPVTVGDAITNQFPPIMDEVPNFMPFMN